MSEPAVVRPHLDVRELPEIAFKTRDPMWWGVAALVCIEGMLYALLVVSYFYIRGGLASWPPEAFLPLNGWLALAATLLQLASVVPTHLQNAAAERADIPGMRRTILAATLLGALSVAVRVLQFKALPFYWYDHAFGSVVYTLLGLQTFHLVSGVGENLLITTLLYVGPVEEKHRVDVYVSGGYWYFTVAAQVVLSLLLFADPGNYGMHFGK